MEAPQLVENQEWLRRVGLIGRIADVIENANALKLATRLSICDRLIIDHCRMDSLVQKKGLLQVRLTVVVSDHAASTWLSVA